MMYILQQKIYNDLCDPCYPCLNAPDLSVVSMFLSMYIQHVIVAVTVTSLSTEWCIATGASLYLIHRYLIHRI